jgi:prepilin-type processing-associated H-X9-DG protein
VDALFKTAGQLVFSTTGKPPGNNHEKSGGNFLFCDGHAESSPARAPFSMTATQGVVLLNPRP